MMTSSKIPKYFVLQKDTYDVQSVLGQGAFGEVLKVTRRSGSNEVYALKKIPVENKAAVEMVKTEIEVLRKCKHDHIVKIYSCGVTKISESQFVLILLEYCEGGNLNSRLVRSSGDETNLRWMKELTDAICYLHTRPEKKIAHRDLKPENVLLTAHDSIKLGDFGLAREFAVLKQPNATEPDDQALVSYMTTVYMNTQLGTPSWMAPEVFEGRYTEKADIFSLGLIFYVILERKYLNISGERYYVAFINFRGQIMGLGKAMTKDRSIRLQLDGQSRPKQELVYDMLDYDPKERPSAQKVLQQVGEMRSFIRLKGGEERSSGGGCCK